jgi:hypothetical protein
VAKTESQLAETVLGVPIQGQGENSPNHVSRFEPLKTRSSRREEALTSSSEKRMSLLTSAATVHGEAEARAMV